MKTAILVLYIVTGGHMSTVRIPQADMAQCEKAAPALASTLGALHAECKAKKAPKASKES